MLSELFGLQLPAASLAGYAARLGSDCPFFIYNTPMMGTGRGEILTPFDLDSVLGPEYEIRVVVPQDIHVSTADAYRGIVPRNVRKPAMEPLPLEEVLRSPVGLWRDSLVNDFEALPSKHSKTIFMKKAPSTPACPAPAAPCSVFSGNNYLPVPPVTPPVAWLAASPDGFSITSSFRILLLAFFTRAEELWPKLQLRETITWRIGTITFE